MKRFLLLLIFLIPFHLQAQITISPGQINDLGIFLDTDDFKGDYLDNMENSQRKFWSGKMKMP